MNARAGKAVCIARSVAMCAALGLGLLACSAEEGEKAAAGPCGVQEERKPAPELRLQSLDGREYSLAELKGKTVVIDFWATWCPPCEFQIPVLNAIYDAWRDRGVMVLGVSVDTDGAAVVAPYAAEHKVRYPVLLGDEALARRFGAVGFPTSVIVAPDGTIGRAHPGLLEQDELDARIACLQPATALPPSGAPAEPVAGPEESNPPS
jgi:thiol-disulfide isomerase/thioredoxin